MTEENKIKEKFKDGEHFIGLGLIFGVVIGVLTDNIGLWIALGLAIGAGMSGHAKKKAEQTNEGDFPDQGDK